MHRRRLLTGVATATTLSLAGCAGGSTNDGSDSDQEQKETTVQRNGEQYFFQDEKDTLGHLSENEAPAEAKDWQVVHNELTEDQWEEKQLNDVEMVEKRFPPGSEYNFSNMAIDQSVDEIIQNAKQIYVNEEFNFTRPDIINIEEEDDEVTFTRALNKAGREAGVDSSALANDLVANIAEYAVNELDVVDFNDYKLSSVPATEETRDVDGLRGGHVGGVINGRGNSGFRHIPSVLQYVKDGEAKLKYAEVTTAGFATILGEDAIREPEESMYQEELGQGRLKNGKYPLHAVTCLDYTKAREIESMEGEPHEYTGTDYSEILGYDIDEGYEKGGETFTKREGLGDFIAEFLVNLVDDVSVTGYDDGENDINPDVDRPAEVGRGSTLASDEFGESLEEAIVNPTIEKLQYIENIGRGIYNIRQKHGWDTQLALLGKIDSPEIRVTTLRTISQVRSDQAYDQVRERITG